MQKLLFASAAAGAFAVAGAAVAQAAPVNWNGVYVDAGAGVGTWTGDTTTQNAVTGSCILCIAQRQGGLGGLATVGVGFDHQVAPRWVLGAFVDGDISDLRGSLQDQGPFFVGTESMSGAVTVAGRAGFLVRNDTMIFADLGWTNGWFNRTSMRNAFTGAGTGFSTPSFERGGFAVGAGVEAAVAPHWFARAEYRYADYGSVTLPDTNGASSASSIRFHPVVTTMRATLAYKWGYMGGPSTGVSNWAPATWTGFYVAGGGGFGQWSADTTTKSATTGVCILCQTQTQGGRGGFATAAVGYDWQAAPRWVVGAFVDGDLADIEGSIQDQGPFFVGTKRENSAWAVGARAGFLLTPGTMGYVNAGFSQANFSGTHMSNSFAGAPSAFSTQSTNQGGYFVGFGAETAVAPNWFLRAEYRFAQYEKTDLLDTRPVGSPDNTITFLPTVQTARAEVVFKFK